MIFIVPFLFINLILTFLSFFILNFITEEEFKKLSAVKTF